MLLYHYERKGLWILTTLLICTIVLPKQLSKNKNPFFLLENITLPDTLTINIEQPIVRLELNQADSLSLIKIKGIGPYYAHKILNFRKRLGGFYTVKQLKELNMTYFNVDSSAFLFHVNPLLIQKRELDTLTFKEILRHPYLEYEDVILIFQAKKQYKRVSYDTLQQHRVLPSHKLKKIKPYFK